MNKVTLMIPLLLFVVIVSFSAVYVIPEGRQAVITQFGRPVGSPIMSAGVHFKKPFVQTVRMFEKRILRWDGYPNQVPTKDKKYIHVDTTARWRIVDALTFLRTVQNERGARARLDGILDAVTRDVIANQNLVEAVRNSNTILEERSKLKAVQKEARKTIDVTDFTQEEISGEIESISVGREQISRMIIEGAAKELVGFGIELIDVQLRRISYEESVEKKVYDRMISERKRMAEKIRSYGKGEEAKIRGKTNRDLLKIQSAAYRKAQVIKGKAEGKATDIYANALSRDPDFYEFIRTLEAYKKSIPEETKMILSTESKFFNLLKRGR